MKLLASVGAAALFLTGCTAQLTPDSNLNEYYVLPSTSLFSNHLICGKSPLKDSCELLRSGDAVSQVLQSPLTPWLNTLAKGPSFKTRSGQNAYEIDANLANALLRASITDEAQKIRDFQIHRMGPEG